MKLANRVASLPIISLSPFIVTRNAANTRVRIVKNILGR